MNLKENELYKKIRGKFGASNKNGIDRQVDDVNLTAEKAKKEFSEKKRALSGKMLMFVNTVSCVMVLFQLYIAGPGNLGGNITRAIHLGFGMFLVFMLYPLNKKSSKTKIPLYDLVFAILAVIANLYIVVNFASLTARAGLMTKTDTFLGIILIILLLEAARRVVGTILTSIAGFFLIYTVFGQYFPGVIAHRGVSIANLVRHMYLTLEGIYGVALGVSASFIFLFVIMGAILTHMGTGEFLIDLAICAFGKQRGGPAKAAVVSSSLFGLISGSSVANIATTGTFTIPLMKKTGYKPYFAGSVEAAASIGGQIMPPVMGAAAFIIAQNLGQPYLKVCAAAAFPAFLYFSGIFFSVHQEAVRMGLKGLPEEDIPKFKDIIKRAYLILPLIVIISMMVIGFSPAFAGLTSIISAIVLSWFNKETRLTPRKLFCAFSDGAKNALEVLIACATVGFIVGSFTLSGMGLKLASLVVELGNGSLFITLIFTAIASLILGMGVPTTANYVMMAMITAPALVLVGVMPMAAHLFCFYYGIISDLTPPVALGSLAGAGIAGAKFWPTALNGTKLGIAAYVAPFLFVYHPVLLLGQMPFETVHILFLLFAFIGLMILSCGLYGFVITKTTWYERIGLFVSAYLVAMSTISIILIGTGIFILIYILQKKRILKLEKISQVA
jgi:TRAP transporter 4TM/12TM fusion protein